MGLIRTIVVAAVLSGVPSTAHALATGRDPLQATRAAGALAHKPGVVAGAGVHLAVTTGWTLVLTAVDRRRRLGLVGGAVAGLLIAVVDLEVVGRHQPAIRALPRLPQWLDHIAFGAVVGRLLALEQSRQPLFRRRPQVLRGLQVLGRLAQLLRRLLFPAFGPP